MPRPSRVRLLRFDRSERWIHRSFGVVMGVCLATAAMLYIPELSLLVGQRDVLRTVHLWAGYALPVPLVVGLVGSPGFRADARRLSRFLPTDAGWLRPGRARNARAKAFEEGAAMPNYPVGKFNAGQKLNASFTLGATMVMFATGLMLANSDFFSDRVRAGNTFVHDWLALAFGIVVLGHMWKAYADPQARVGMRTGYVSGQWAREHHSLWAAEVVSSREATANPTGDSHLEGPTGLDGHVDPDSPSGPV